jgi:hypothetical protein
MFKYDIEASLEVVEFSFANIYRSNRLWNGYVDIDKFG